MDAEDWFSRFHASFPDESIGKPSEKLPLEVTKEEASALSKIATRLSECGCSPVEGTVLSTGGCPEDLRAQVCAFHDRLNEIIGPLRQETSCYGDGKPVLIGLSDFNSDAVKKLLAGEGEFSDFVEDLRKYHSAPRCNVVWKQNTIAYRCQTCGLNSCMSLCAECFEAADHTGHDYSRFWSSVGGVCDCGNPDVMLEQGFCRNHRDGGPKLSDNLPSHSTALLRCVLVKLVTRLVVCLRRWKMISELPVRDDPMESGCSVLETNSIINKGISPVIRLMAKIGDAGSVVTDMLIDILLDENFYKELTRKDASMELDASGDNARVVEAPDWRLLPNLERDIKTLLDLPAIRKFVSRPLHKFEVECVLDELVIYLIRTAFLPEFVDVLLNFLYDQKYKEKFATRFFAYYPYTTAIVAEMLTEIPRNSREGCKIAERIVHISVQICSGAKICSWLQNKINIINCVLESANIMSIHCARPSQINHFSERFYASIGQSPAESDNDWLTASIDDNVFFEKYADLFVLTDTQNLLIHEPIAKAFFASETLIRMYLRHVELFQGLSVEWRIVSGDHRINDWVNLAQRSFNVEYDACALPMHHLVHHITSLAECDLFYRLLVDSIEEWFKAIRIVSAATETCTPPFCVSFHIPLHRNLATLLFQMQSLGDTCKPLVDSLRNDAVFLKKLILHPLRIHAVRAEYYAGMWTRNGQGTRVAIGHYCKPPLAFSFQSADLLLLRFAAANVNQEFFWAAVLDSFHIKDCIAYPEDAPELALGATRNLVTRRVWVPHLIDGVLRLLLDLIVPQRDTKPDNDRMLEEEIVVLLARQDLPYSHIRSIIPCRGGTFHDEQMKGFDEMVNRVANFVEPDQDDSIQHGRYELKDELYDSKVCPVFCRLRSFGQNDFNSYMNHMEERERSKICVAHQGSPWLGFRLLDFDKEYPERFESVRDVAALITQPSFFIFAYETLSKILKMDFHSLVLEQLVYLLTLCVQLLRSDFFDQLRPRLYHPNEFHEPIIYTEAHKLSVREADDPRQVVISFFLKDFGSGSSLLTLLIELFFKAFKTAQPDSSDAHALLALRKCLDPVDDSMTRIHGGAIAYVGRLIRLLCAMSEDIRRELTTLSESSTQQDNSMEVDAAASSSDVAAGDRKAKLLKKREAVLRAMQKKGAKVMKLHMESEGISQAEMDRIDTKSANTVMYECPICSETTEHSLANPIGLFVHTRPNTVTHNSVRSNENAVTDLMQVVVESQKKQECLRNPAFKILRSWNSERESYIESAYHSNAFAAIKFTRLKTGIEVRTCGHFAHLSCFKGYINSIINSANAVLKVDFTVSCPMCRAPVNTILPLKMEYGREKVRADFDICDVSQRENALSLYLSRLHHPRLYPEQNSKLYEQMQEHRVAYDEFEDIAYRQLQKSIVPKFSVVGNFKGIDARLGFVQSNIERLVMFATLDLPMPSFSKGSVVEHIMSGAIALSLHVDTQSTVTQITALIKSMDGSVPIPSDNPPLLLCDYQSLYLRCCSLPLVDERFVDADRLSYCKLFYRVIAVLCLTRALQDVISKADSLAAVSDFIEQVDFGNETLLARALQAVFNGSRHILMEGKDLLFVGDDFCVKHALDLSTVEKMKEYALRQAELLLLHLSRFAIVLSKEVFKEDFTADDKTDFACNSFAPLYSILMGEDADESGIAELAFSGRFFLLQMLESLGKCHSNPLKKIMALETYDWRYRSVLTLPTLYDKLFSTFLGRKCENCGREPQHQMLCLLCGALMCLSRCSKDVVTDGEIVDTQIEQHTMKCGAGCCCYLSVNSTMIVINYYRQAVLWGTVYLDSHGEEDRNLFRGKPLFLSENRMKQLQRGWFVQDLDRRAHLHWIPLDQLSMALRQSYQLL